VSVRIDVDVFEQISGIPKFPEGLGASIKIERLKAGDYRVGDNTILERKSVADLHGSDQSGRPTRIRVA